MKNIIGLDLGTNSIGWSYIQLDQDERNGRIIAAGSRILPMSQDILGKFDSGQSHSQTAERTGYRGIRRIRERYLLRRERLHRVLHIIGFLPAHYSGQIDFNKRLGQFLPGTEPKLPYDNNTFLFQASYNEMLKDFAIHQPQILEGGKKIPHDWTLYYLRKKALTKKIEKEELAWLLLNYNQKRGYYQLRGEDDNEKENQLVEFHSLLVTHVEATDDKSKDEIWYNVHLENGWIYRRTSKVPLDWEGKRKDFIVTTDLNDDGSVKTDKEGKEKRSFRAPSDDDWTLLKKKTEYDIDKSGETVGTYIYDHLLKDPDQKIKGKLVRVIERKFYRAELESILNKQKEFHPALNDRDLYAASLQELYSKNESHRNNISQKDFTYLFLQDIIFYQRPLKSKKSLISNCKFERKAFQVDGKMEIQPLKCIPASHPLFQEFRLWQFIQNLRIYERERQVDGKMETDVNITETLLPSIQHYTDLFEWLNDRKEINQKILFKQFFKLKKTDNYRWNYVEAKEYPCNETRALILTRLQKTRSVPTDFLSRENEETLWHILYSVEDKEAIGKALATFARKKGLGEDFTEQFRKFPPFKKDYGSFSSKALSKLLPLIRVGKFWKEENIAPATRKRIDNLLNAEFDETIRDRVRDKAIKLQNIEDFSGLPVWLASYIVYDRHSEDELMLKWKNPADIQLLPQHSLRNPIVEQVVNETLQVIRDIWKHYGNSAENFFQEIHVELGREMKNPADKRKEISARNTENENTNLRMKALLAELLNDGEYENVRPYSPMQQEILKIYEEGVLHATADIPEDILKISKQAQPTGAELTRYKLWLQQKYRSPYTGNIIPLNKLFTREYDIEHIIPQSRYFDDSFSNKVICEVEVNKDKDNSLAYEYIKNNSGKKISLSFGREATLFTIEQFEDFIKNNYAGNRGKMKKLLMEDIPEEFIQRQLNDSRYISKVIKNLLSNIVREEGEQETTSKNVISSNGAITSVLKKDWGLHDVWNDLITPRFERLNQLTNSLHFGEWTNKEGKQVFQTQVPIELQKGFSKKRIDHRHHALDAIVVACSSRNHINYLNNESALGKISRDEKDKRRYDLKHKLCFKKYNDDTKRNYSWEFHKPWDTFTQETKAVLQNIVISFKQNLRVINKTQNRYLTWRKDANGVLRKELVPQTKGANWAIRKPMHKDTVAGLVQLKFKKEVTLAAALDNPEMIVNKNLRDRIKQLLAQYQDKKKVVALLKADFPRVAVTYWDRENVASRVKVDDSFKLSAIESITDTGIQQIMRRHLELNDGDPALAFSPDGVDVMNREIVNLNNGKHHKPIYKVRTYTPTGNKFPVGQTGNKKDKYVVAAKGTNLFFAIYKDESGKRKYEAIPLNIVIERLKQGLSAVPEINEKGDRLLFHLSPNDLVYVPDVDEQINGNKRLSHPNAGKIYRFTDGSGTTANFVQHHIAALILSSDKKDIERVRKQAHEFFTISEDSGKKTDFVNEVGMGSAQDKQQKSMDGIMIKECCIKIQVDRLGNIKHMK